MGTHGWEQKFGQASGSRAGTGPWGTLTRSKKGTIGLSASPLEWNRAAARVPGRPPACPAQRSPCPLLQMHDPTHTMPPSAVPSTGRGFTGPCVRHVVPAQPAQP